VRIANPTHIGTALAVTVGVGYTACALLFWAWPEAAANFMNALFHGLASFFYALVIAMVWAFVLGVVFGWVLELVGGRRVEQAS
jgi:hypothetical protein